MSLVLSTKGRMPPTDGTSHWRFPVESGVMLRAGSHEDLVKIVFDYRVRNNIPPGDVVRDISNWYCAQYPRFCSEEPRNGPPGTRPAHDAVPPRYNRSSEPILNRVTRWASIMAHKMPRGGFHLVTQDVANARAEICVNCHEQNAGWRGGCGGCSATTLAIMQQLKSLKKTTKDGSLGACSVTGWGNMVAIWMEPENLEVSVADRAALPNSCWRKSL